MLLKRFAGHQTLPPSPVTFKTIIARNHLRWRTVQMKNVSFHLSSIPDDFSWKIGRARPISFCGHFLRYYQSKRYCPVLVVPQGGGQCISPIRRSLPARREPDKIPFGLLVPADVLKNGFTWKWYCLKILLLIFACFSVFTKRNWDFDWKARLSNPR